MKIRKLDPPIKLRFLLNLIHLNTSPKCLSQSLHPDDLLIIRKVPQGAVISDYLLQIRKVCGVLITKGTLIRSNMVFV